MKPMSGIKGNNKAGFTLVEALIVLLLVCSFVLLPTVALKKWQQQLEKTFFYYQFEKSVLHLQQVAITDHRGTRIELHKNQQMIIFYTIHTELAWKQLKLPQSIQLESKDTIFFSAGKGNISTDQPGNGNIPKVVFSDGGPITYQFQMGSGRFERK
ncbi:competence type IV pilus minor pilin ComGD [Candidatus Enterococcus murrayae]|uniref:Type II secretion system protein n=1 Tax=Candidatus Enterococcus murrayae TaxID=2815321 RepID=A0ABS3HMX3_9ENTE|nr:competence type IV pilus minor pilin ComGD [Enterococcus sp. MJM16]MBO0454795.1 type II secretion system protein [Enterococcus sp. MJM16]